MTLIILATIAIVLSTIVFGAYLGFAISDLSCNEPYYLVLGLLVSGFAFVLLIDNAVGFLLFGMSYMAGMFLSDILGAK